jgi:hypothetical protein
MRNRLVLAAAAFSALALAVPAALAAPATPVMDGKKVKELVLKANGGVQTHDDDNADVLGTSDRVNCAAPRCAILKFVYKPAKGVKDGLMFTATWTNPASDIDLYVGEVGKSGDKTEVAHCGGAATTSESLYVATDNLKPGKTYALVADMFRSVNEDVTAKVAFGSDAVKKTVPAEADGLVYPVNCTL